jgi:hypothetical protein
VSAMWLLQRRRVEQPAVDPSGGWLVIALDGRAGLAVSPSVSPGSAPVGGQVWLVPGLPGRGQARSAGLSLPPRQQLHADPMAAVGPS